MFVKPRQDYVIRDPAHLRPLPPSGAHVPNTSYWHRRLRDGDVVLAEPPAEAAAPQAVPTAEAVTTGTAVHSAEATIAPAPAAPTAATAKE